ncbi:hypothetical protein KEM55_009253, partial [Ascosphaera atra]
QEAPSPFPNFRSLRRSSRVRRQHRQKVQEPEQAQEATGEAQAETGGEEGKEETTQEADQPQVPTEQAPQHAREEDRASCSSFALSSPPESMADPEEGQDLEGLVAGACVTPEPSASPVGSVYTILSPTIPLEEELPAVPVESDGTGDIPLFQLTQVVSPTLRSSK